MKLFIPEIGTPLLMSADWEFTLYTENRNDALADAAGLNRDSSVMWLTRTADHESAELAGWTPVMGPRNLYIDCWAKKVTIPAGTVITVDRIYIRKGISEYSSVSFNLNRKTVSADHSEFARKLATQKGRCRFWAKLADVNNIEFSTP